MITVKREPSSHATGRMPNVGSKEAVVKFSAMIIKQISRKNSGSTRTNMGPFEVKMSAARTVSKLSWMMLREIKYVLLYG